MLWIYKDPKGHKRFIEASDMVMAQDAIMSELESEGTHPNEALAAAGTIYAYEDHRGNYPEF